jgi:hypothetical protein
MRALIDTDVLLDVLLARAPFSLDDYKHATLSVYSPTDFLSHLNSQQT